jgi:hypothetical protein
MRYIVHVIDEASQHEKNGQDFLVKDGLDLNNNICGILKTDAFYSIEVSSAIDAVTTISNIIMVQTIDGQNSLAEEIIKTNKALHSSDFTNDYPDYILKSNNLEQSNNPYGQCYMASCQLRKKENNDVWYELHNVYFYVVEENKIMEITN